MFGAFKAWFAALSTIGKISVVTVASVATIGIAGAATNPQLAPPVDVPPKVQGDNIEHKTVTTTEAIAFDTKTVDDPTLPAGTDKVTTEGVNGMKTKTYDVTYTNDIETNRTLVKEDITTPPVTKVINRGTYIAPAPENNCPNGTYVNSAGNTVCRPYSASSAPSGATARCADGTYSFSQSRRGTCSSHGGVAGWL